MGKQENKWETSEKNKERERERRRSKDDEWDGCVDGREMTALREKTNVTFVVGIQWMKVVSLDFDDKVSKVLESWARLAIWFSRAATDAENRRIGNSLVQIPVSLDVLFVFVLD